MRFLRGADARTLDRVGRESLLTSGLVAEDGTPTELGRALREELLDAPVLVLHRADAESLCAARLYVGDRHAVLDCAAHGEHSGAVRVVPASAVPLELARWGRLDPGFGDEEHVYGPFAEADVCARTLDPAAPPPKGLTESERALWAGEWQAWGATCEERGIRVAYLDVRGFGTFMMRPQGSGAILFVSRPSSLLWGDLQTLPTEMVPAEPEW